MDPNLTRRQREVLDFICAFNRTQGYFPTLREVGAHFGVAVATAQSHLDTLKRKGALDWDKGTSRALRITGGLEPKRLNRSGVQGRRNEVADIIEVPVLGAVSAGPGLLAEGNVMDTVVMCGGFLGPSPGELFALTVRGESMTGAGILPGDMVFVQKQSAADEGDIVVALVDDEAVVKFLNTRTAGTFLRSANEAYPPRQVGEGASILGKVVGQMRRY